MMKMKRLISAIAAGCMVLMAVPVLPEMVQDAAIVAKAETFEDFGYQVFENKIIGEETIAITGYFGSDTEIVIPAKINDKSVTDIGMKAFYKCKLNSITIPEGVMFIEPSAFSECLELKEIIIPDSVTEIGWCAFTGCTALEEIVLPNNLETIDYLCFGGCTGLKKITIPDSVSSIGWAAFQECSELTEITIPSSVTSIGEYAFMFCSNLKKVTILGEVTSIEEDTFAGCTELSEIIIPGSVTRIKYDAFANCSNLTIYSYDNTYAQTYAEENNIPFVSLGAAPETTPTDTTPAPTTYGDLDASGDVGLLDVILLNKNLLGLTQLTEQGRANADVNLDGAVDSTDSLYILQSTVSLVTLPVQ